MDLMAPTLDDMLFEVEREIRKRHEVYPRFVEAGKMSQRTADRQIELMQAVAEHLKKSGAKSKEKKR